MLLVVAAMTTFAVATQSHRGTGVHSSTDEEWYGTVHTYNIIQIIDRGVGGEGEGEGVGSSQRGWSPTITISTD